MLYRINILFLLFLIEISIQIKASVNQYQFKILNKTDGLSNNQIKCIYKDKKGFLWFGTISGLNRFDGYSFKTFLPDDKDSTSINDNYIMNITEDHLGRLWIQGLHGFNIYDQKTEIFSLISKNILKDLSLPDTANIIDIKQDSQGNYFYFDPSFGLFKYNSADNKIIAIQYNPSNPSCLISPRISAMEEDSKGNFWLIYKNGIIEKLESKTNKITFRNHFLADKYNNSNMTFKLCIDQDDDLWIVNTNSAIGAFLFNTKTYEFQHFHTESEKIKLNKNILTDIVKDDKGAIWIGADHGGINVINKKDFTIHYILNDREENNSLSHNSITCLYKDNTDIIWVGTYKTGINYYHPDIFKFKLYKNKLSDPHSLPYNDINCYTEDDKGNIWIGTNGGGLVYFNRINDKFYTFSHDPNNSNSISTNTIVCLLIDHDKKLWIGTFFGGLNCYDGNKFIRYLPNPSDPESIPSPNIWSIFEDSEDNLWIGTLDHGLLLFNTKNKTFDRFTDKKGNYIESNQINSIMEDKDGNLWFGTTGGIYVLEKKTGEFVHYSRDDNDPKSLVSNGIYNIIEDKRGLIWAASRKGLNLFDKEQKIFRRFTKEDGIPDNLLLTLIEDNDGNLWMGTPNGLCNMVIKKQTVTDSLTFEIRNYNEADGLQGREFNQFSAYKTSNGELLFGGANGFNIFLPSEIKRNNIKSEIAFTDFKVFNKSVKLNEKVNGQIILKESITYTNKILLKHKINVFTIEYTSLNFSHPQKILYQYILEGFNEDWVTTDWKNRKATYTNLNPDEYIFRVRATNSLGRWAENEANIKIKILAPWWKTIWFKIGLGLSLIFIAFSLYRFRIKMLKIQQRILEQKVNERTYELSQANAQLEEKQEEITQQNIELDRHRSNLEYLVNERTMELEDAKKRAEESDRLKTAFLANMSHELRTPMNAIVGFSSLLVSKDINDKDKNNYINAINNNCESLLVLINDLLEISLIEANQVDVKKSPFEVDSILNELENYFKLKNDKKNTISFDKKNKNQKLVLNNDSTRFRQIMTNLLNNAMKYTESGFINFGYDIFENEVKFYVSDSGIGISPSEFKNIFDPFHKIERTKTKIYRGAGLGLSICKSLVELMGGKIWLESQLGKGTTFYFTLPFEKAELIFKPTEKKEKIKLNWEGLKILVAEDEPMNFTLIKKILEPSKAEIIWAKDGSEAVDFVKKNSKLSNLIILMDIKMPVMNGIEAFKIIKRINKNIPIIAVTAYAHETDKYEILKSGFSDYIVKPLRPEKLLEIVNMYI